MSKWGRKKFGGARKPNERRFVETICGNFKLVSEIRFHHQSQSSWLNEWMNEWLATWNHHDDWRDMFQIYLINKSAYPSSRKAKEPKVKLILFVKGFQKCEPEKLLMGFKSLYWVTSKLFPCPPNPSLFALKLSVNSGKSSARALHFLQSVFTCFVIDTRKGLLFPQRTGHPGTLTLPWWNA